jgi:signal transduction histidine kinase/AmiR/NasT family two-component response regulator
MQMFRQSRSLYLQLLYVTLAFALMVFSSYMFVNNMLVNYLERDAENILTQTQIRIANEFNEAETLMISIRRDVRNIIMGGGSAADVLRYFNDISVELRKKEHGFIFDGLHGYFEALGNVYIQAPGWTVPDDYDAKARPWYAAAVEAGGNIIATPTYLSMRSGEYQVNVACQIFNDNGVPLGVITMNVSLDNIKEFVTNTRITENGYGFLTNELLELIAHPQEDYVARKASEVNQGFVDIEEIVAQRQELYKLETTDYQNKYSIFYFKPIEKGWYLGIVTPKGEYNKDLNALLLFLGILGIVLMVTVCVLLVRIDITKERTSKARDDAESANKAKSIFLANMSHEIRTPMNSIIGFSELAQDSLMSYTIKDPDADAARTIDYLDKISTNAKWLLQIINDLLDVSKIEAGKMVLEYISFDLQEVFEHCRSIIMPRVVEKGITLHFNTEPLAGKKLIGDPVKLHQILINLLSNAVKFTNTGSVELLTSIITKNENSLVLHFEVKDSGIGMTSEQIKTIFDPFIQADETVARKYGGTGLGLAITKNYVEMMGSKLNLESKPGGGSKFSFDIKFDMVDAPVTESAEKTLFSMVERPTFMGEVLVCEDNSMNQQVICDHLKKVGINAVLANDGQKGVDIVMARMQKKEKPFDLIFMDIHMPILDGMKAASRITSMGVKTPIVALTANILSHDLEIYKKHGMVGYLGKPFTSQELWRCLKNHLQVVSVSKIDKSRQSENDMSFKKQLQLYFVKSNQNTFEEIKDALDNNDIKLAYRLVHTLKSSAAQIGEGRLQSEAASAESMLTGGENLLTQAHLDALEAELELVIEKLTPLLSEAAAEIEEQRKLAVISEEDKRKLFEELKQMLQTNNPGCESLLKDIRLISGTEELAQYVEDFDFKKALEALSKLNVPGLST